MQDSEKQIYYDIIVKTWKTFADVSEHAEYSDSWWVERIDKFDAIIKQYRNTEYASFTSKLVQHLLDEHERRERNGKELLTKAGIGHSRYQDKDSSRVDSTGKTFSEQV